MRGQVVGFLLLIAGLAGCSSSGSSQGDADIIVTSNLPELEVTSEDERPVPEAPKEGTRGHIAGFVVSTTVRPIEGAKIRLPGMDVEQVSDKDGSFGFVDLRPGPYFMTINATGYYAAEAELDVRSDEFTRLKIILTPIPPPDPYHVTMAFDGFADVTDNPATLGFGLVNLCRGCQIPFYLDMPPTTLIIEATMENPSPTVGFRSELDEAGECCGSIDSRSSPNPMRIELPFEVLYYTTNYELRVMPESLVPETNRAFQVFVTAFYHQPAPEGWSFVNGDT